MQTRYGISLSEDGSFLLVYLQYVDNSWKIKKIKKWDCQLFFHNFLLLHRPVSLVLPSKWIRTLPEETNDLLVCINDIAFSVCTNQLEYDHFSELLQNNLIATYPDDALLATIPQNFINDIPNSFISIFNNKNSIKIGVIIDGVLKSAFNVCVTSEAEVTGYIGRIERYWQTIFPDERLPSEYFLLNDCPYISTENNSIHRISCGSNDADVLKAMGAALCDISLSVPQLHGKTVLSRFRLARSILLIGSLALTLLTILLTTTLYGYVWYGKQKVYEVKNEYKNILNNNNEIRELLTAGDNLSNKVLKLTHQVSHPTVWGQLLHSIGKLRPQGLFLDQLGSEPLTKNSDKIRIAFSGWCKNETIVTDFIKALNNTPILSEVTLSRMERDKRQKDVFRFKIICNLLIFEN